MSNAKSMGELRGNKRKLHEFYNNNHHTYIKQIKEEVGYQPVSSCKQSIQPLWVSTSAISRCVFKNAS